MFKYIKKIHIVILLVNESLVRIHTGMKIVNFTINLKT